MPTNQSLYKGNHFLTHGYISTCDIHTHEESMPTCPCKGIIISGIVANK